MLWCKMYMLNIDVPMYLLALWDQKQYEMQIMRCSEKEVCMYMMASSFVTLERQIIAYLSLFYVTASAHFDIDLTAKLFLLPDGCSMYR